MPRNFYRRTKVGIPPQVKSLFPNNDTLRLGDYYSSSVHGGFSGIIDIYLVPKKGSGPYKQIAMIERRFEKPEQFSEEVKGIAKDKDLLTRILLEHLGIIHQGMVQQHV